jgi:hypothetical protein
VTEPRGKKKAAVVDYWGGMGRERVSFFLQLSFGLII